jgi:hypothetical protein
MNATMDQAGPDELWAGVGAEPAYKSAAAHARGALRKTGAA